jgi:hypothetical protein
LLPRPTCRSSGERRPTNVTRAVARHCSPAMRAHFEVIATVKLHNRSGLALQPAHFEKWCATSL